MGIKRYRMKPLRLTSDVRPHEKPTCPLSVADVSSGRAYMLIDTLTFVADVDKLWGEDERFEFLDWLANNPDVGDVGSGSGGCRKVRWSRGGSGKRGACGSSSSNV